jgi:2-methylisocitrate lyase-like PEP mutase family enzyme
MSVTQSEKAARFRALHDGPDAFVIPNPWDVGSARILAGLGFKALATSSAASASALGRRDHGLNRDEALAHAHLIVDATDLPVSADLGKGFGDAPEVVAETIRFAAEKRPSPANQRTRLKCFHAASHTAAKEKNR